MSKRVFGEIIAGILVVATVFIPKIVFDRYLAYNDDAYIVAAAEITTMAVTSLLIASAVYYIARRIREFFASHD